MRRITPGWSCFTAHVIAWVVCIIAFDRDVPMVGFACVGAMLFFALLAMAFWTSEARR